MRDLRAGNFAFRTQTKTHGKFTNLENLGARFARTPLFSVLNAAKYLGECSATTLKYPVCFGDLNVDVGMDLGTHMPLWLEASRPA